MDHPGWRRNRPISSRLKNHGTKTNEDEQKMINVHLNRLPSYSELLRRIGPAAAQELTDCEGPNVPVSLLPGFSKTHNAGDDRYHQQAIDREFQREMRLAEEALRRREELGVRRWLQLQRQQQKILELGNVAVDPDYYRSPEHKRPFEPGQGRYASNTGVATYPNSTSRSAYGPEITEKTKTSHSGRGERKELDKDFREAS